MIHTPKRVLLAAASLHLGLIFVVACRDTFAVLILGGTLLPNQWKAQWQIAEHGTKTALGQNLPRHNVIRQTVGTYLTAAGIEAGYGFFAPNVPGTNELLFELHWPDGRVEYERPQVTGGAAALRLTNLLDMVERVEDESVRQGLIKYLAYAIWREHPDVTNIRAVLGTINLPPSDEFVRNVRQSFRVSHAYEFTFQVQPER